MRGISLVPAKRSEGACSLRCHSARSEAQSQNPPPAEARDATQGDVMAGVAPDKQRLPGRRGQRTARRRS